MDNLEDSLEEKLKFDVFDLVGRAGLEKLASFKNELDLQTLGGQIESLFNEVHEFTVSVCAERLREIENRKATQSHSKRIKLTHGQSERFDSYPTACNVLSDFLFELMNQGVYAEVAVRLRQAFGLITLYLALIELHREKVSWPFVLALLNKIDYGLLYSPPFLNKLLARVATCLHDYLTVKQPIAQDYDSMDSDRESCQEAGDHSGGRSSEGRSPSHPDRSKEIRRVECIGLEDFYTNYFVKKIPVIIENAINDWPSVRNWNLNYLLGQAAYRLVPVEIGSRYTDANWTQKVITIKEFVDQFIVRPKEADPKGYCAQYELFERIERLSNDFFIPDYCALGNVDGPNEDGEHEDVHINAW